MAPRSNKVADGARKHPLQEKNKSTRSVPWVNVICPQRHILHFLTRDQRFYMFQLVNGSAWTLMVTFFTFASLFANDINTVVKGPYTSHSELTIVLVFCFTAFALDCILKSTFDLKYPFSFYFWLDLFSTFSLGIEFVFNTDGASGLLLARTARATRAGARLTRLIRLLKLIRMIRVLKLWKTLVQRLGGSHVSYVDYQEDNEENMDDNRANQLTSSPPELITERITTQISRKLVICILFMLAAYSILESTKTDLGPHVGIQLMSALADSNVSTAVVQELFFTFARAYSNEMVNATAALVGEGVVFSEGQNFDRLCSSEIDASTTTTSTDDIQFYNYISGFRLDCDVKDLFVDMDFTADSVDQAYTGIFQTLLLVLFILGWAWMLQRDVQHYVVEPLLGVKDGLGLGKRKSPHNKKSSPGGAGRRGQPSAGHNTIGYEKTQNTTNDLIDSTLELMVRNAQDRAEPQRTEKNIRSIIEDVGTSNMHKLVTCLMNLRTSLVQERALQDAIDGVVEVITQETPFQSALYSPVVDNVLTNSKFRESNTEVRRWVVGKLLSLPKTTYVELSNAAVKKLGVSFVDQSTTPKEQSKPAGAFNFKSQMEHTTAFGIKFDAFATELNALSRKLEKFDFDVTVLRDLTEDQPLCWIGFTVLTKHSLPQAFKMKEKKLIRFLEIIEHGSWIANPFHNHYHSSNFIRTSHWFLTSALVEERVSKLDILALVLSGIIVNYQHTGRTNEFEVDTESQLSVFFDHDFVLERYALAAAFTLLNHESTAIGENMETAKWKLLRSLIIEIILSRSLRTHVGLVEKAKLTRLPPPAEYRAAAATTNVRALAPQPARLMLLQLIANVSNISHVFMKKHNHLAWTERFFTEQFEMGEDEASLQLPISPFCDRDSTQIGHAQIAFFDFVARPALDALGGDVLTGDNYTQLFNNFDANYMLWAKVMNKEQSATTSSRMNVVGLLKGIVPRRLSGALKHNGQGGKHRQVGRGGGGGEGKSTTEGGKSTAASTAATTAAASSMKQVQGVQDVQERESSMETDMENVLSFRSSTQYSRRRNRTRASIGADVSEVAQEVQNMLNKLVIMPYDITTPAAQATLQRANSTADMINKATEDHGN